MSIFDIEDNIDIKIDRDVNIKKVFEQFMLTCVMPGTVKCVVAAPKTNSLLEKLHELYGVPLCDASFAGHLRETLKAAALGLLSHKGRKVVSKDCRGLKKGDALGWIRDFTKEDKDAIIVIENVTQIPEGDPALYDPKQYVENILVRSWKNNDIYIDYYHIDRRNLTVILTCPPEDEEQLRAICSICSYAWVGDIEKKIESKLAEL